MQAVCWQCWRANHLMRGCLPILTGVINTALFSVYITALTSHICSLSLSLSECFCFSVSESESEGGQRLFNQTIQVLWRMHCYLQCFTFTAEAAPRKRAVAGWCQMTAEVEADMSDTMVLSANLSVDEDSMDVTFQWLFSVRLFCTCCYYRI